MKYTDPDGREDVFIKQGNFKERTWFSINIDEPLTKFCARNFAGLGPEAFVKLMDGNIVPMSESGTQFAYSERVLDCFFFCACSFVTVAKIARATSAAAGICNSIDLSGTSEYKSVGGHHVHAKAGFVDNMNYDPKKGFSISQEFMENNGLNHKKMTNMQRKLFKELAESGRPNTLAEHTRIAKEALKAGGATDELIEPLINSSLENPAAQGVTQPTNIPWYNK